jgi:hypothetical protein
MKPEVVEESNLSSTSHLSKMRQLDGRDPWVYFIEYLEKQYNITSISILFEKNAEMQIYYQSSNDEKKQE